MCNKKLILVERLLAEDLTNISFSDFSNTFIVMYIAKINVYLNTSMIVLYAWFSGNAYVFFILRLLDRLKHD